MGLEYRSGTLQAPSAPGKLAGYAAVFSSESADLGGFHEVVRPGAFSKSLASGKNIRALWQHDIGVLLGTTQAKTLRLAEDTRGLKFELDLPATSAGKDLAVLVERGDVGGCSFGFHVIEDRWERRGESWLRELVAVDLQEVTLTESPAYLNTSVALRSLRARQELGGDLYRVLWLQTVRV